MNRFLVSLLPHSLLVRFGFVRFGIVRFGFVLIGLALAWTQAIADMGLRETIGQLAAEGSLDSAYSWLLSRKVGSGNAENSREVTLLLGQLAPSGREAMTHWQALKDQGRSSPEQAQALYLMGQYQYAAGRYHLAIPEFREYLRRYPKGEDADRAGYWMATSCLHLSLTQPERESYLDTGLAYLQRMPARTQPGSYYSALAAECESKLLLAQNCAKSADSILRQALKASPDEERPAMLLLMAQTQATLGKTSPSWSDSLLVRYPHSPEAQYLQRWKGKAPPIPALKAFSEKATAQENPGQKQNASKPWVLQVGSFAQAENAESLSSQMSQLGLSTHIEKAQVGSQTLYQVWVESFATSDEAEAFGNAKLSPHRILFQTRQKAH